MNAATTTPRMDMRDPQVLLMISKAAAEFDFAANGRPSSFDATRRLAGVLKQWLPGPVQDDATVAQFDVSTVGVVSRVFPTTRQTKVSDVVNQAWSMANRLENVSEGTGTTALTEYRSFCIRLGHSLIRFRSSVERSRPSNPYKR